MPRPPQPKRRKAASRRPHLRPLHVHAIDIQALKGPDGTLDGDVRALLVAIGPRLYTLDVLEVLKPSGRTAAEKWNAAERTHFEHRRARLLEMLSGIDKDRDRGSAERRTLVKALWPWVQQLLDHRSDMALMETGRSEERRSKWTDPAVAISWLEEIRARYYSFDPIWEPVEQAIRGFKRFQQEQPDAQQHIGPQPTARAPRRLPTAGNPQLKKLSAGARQAIEPFLDEDDNTKLRRLVGLLPLFDGSGRSLA
jgi:hypothetical protein